MRRLQTTVPFLLATAPAHRIILIAIHLVLHKLKVLLLPHLELKHLAVLLSGFRIPHLHLSDDAAQRYPPPIHFLLRLAIGVDR